MKKIPRIDETYSHLTIIGDVDSSTYGDGRTRYLVRCDCEELTEFIVLADNLLAGRTTRCPKCREASRANQEDYYDIQLRRHGMLAPFGFTPAGAFGNKRGHWLCVCLWCNRFTDVLRTDLLRGRKKHCGCKSRKLHRQSDTCRATRRCWYDMKSRCDDPDDPDYPRYGGRGITYDPLWRDFAIFLAQMGEVPKRGLHLDRIDNDGNYTAGNCRWATPKENANNRGPRYSASESMPAGALTEQELIRQMQARFAHIEVLI